MPLAILFVVFDVLQESIGVFVGIGFTHAVLDRVGPGRDVRKCFAGFQYLSDLLSSVLPDAQ